MTTYQRLKAENEQLRQEIYFLVSEDEAHLQTKLLIQLKYKCALMIERAFWN